LDEHGVLVYFATRTIEGGNATIAFHMRNKTGNPGWKGSMTPTAPGV
jgi:hypothetical protein